MNHQGGQIGQDEARPYIQFETMQFKPPHSSSSIVSRSDQGNYLDNDLDLSLRLSLDPQNQHARSSIMNAASSGVQGHVGDDDILSFQFNRTAAEGGSRQTTAKDGSKQFARGESSITNEQRQVTTSQLNGNIKVNILSGVNGHPRDIEAVFGFGTITPTSMVQQSTYVAQTESFQTNVQMQITALNAPVSNHITRSLVVPLPSQGPLFCQSETPAFFPASENEDRAGSSFQPFSYAPNFLTILRGFLWSADMSSTSASEILHGNFGVGSVAVAPYHNMRNEKETNMVGNTTTISTPNLCFVNGTAHFFGNNSCAQATSLPSPITHVPPGTIYEIQDVNGSLRLPHVFSTIDSNHTEMSSQMTTQ